MQAPKNVFLHPFFVGLPLFYSLSLATQIQLEDMKAPPQALGRRGVGGEVGGKEGGGGREKGLGGKAMLLGVIQEKLRVNPHFLFGVVGRLKVGGRGGVEGVGMCWP